MLKVNAEAIKISVVIPAYNADKWIGRAIQSVLKQTRVADEIIVVDDGSTDHTPEAVRTFADRVILIQQENAGVSAARNAGIIAATGDWIAFLDADDEWFETYLSEQTKLLEHNPDLVWSCANFLMCFCNENERREKLSVEKGIQLLDGKAYCEDYFQAFLAQVGHWTGTMMVQKQVLLETGLFVPGQPLGEDLDLWWRIAYKYPKIGYVPRPLAIYHFHVEGSATKVHTDPRLISDLLARHLELAAQSQNMDRFKPCARHMLRFWIGKCLHDERITSVRELVNRFEFLLPPGYVKRLKILTIWPRATSLCLPLLSRINKWFRLGF